jgi:putative phosphoribosyl transferase
LSGPTFRDRWAAGEKLASALDFAVGRKVLVLAIPRGGVPVAERVAAHLDAPLDVLVTRKLRSPGDPELAVGAVSQDEVMIDPGLVKSTGASDEYLHGEVARETTEVERRTKEYRGGRAPPELAGTTAVIVDDGVATGSTARAAIRAARSGGASSVVLAAPVGSREAIDSLAGIADRVVCLSTPEPFFAVGRFYEDFRQVSDDEVRTILRDADLRWRNARTRLGPG